MNNHPALQPLTRILFRHGLLLLALCYPGGLIYAQAPTADAPSSPTSPAPPPTATAAPPAAAEPAEPVISPRARRKQSLRLCHRYNGKVISYYDKTFVVKNCERVPLDHATLTAHLKAGKPVTQVSSEIINLIPQQSFKPRRQPKALRCKDLEGNYVTIDHEEIYYIKGCKKQRFPDWHTYREHRFHSGPHRSKFLLITAPDLERLRSRNDFPSTLPHAAMTSPPVLSAQQVCAELEGQFVGYYSQLYFVDSCSRRPVDTIQFARLMAQLMVGTTPVPDLTTNEAADEATELTPEATSALPDPPPVPASSPDEPAGEAGGEPSEDPTAQDSLPQVIKITDMQWMSLPLGKAYDLKNYSQKEP